MSLRWFFPTWHGDLRVEQLTPEECVLILHKPTPLERLAAEQIVAACQKESWCQDPIRTDKRKVRYRIKAPMAKVGPIVTRILRPGDAVLTAVVFEDGHVETSSKAEGPTLEALTEKALAPYREAPAEPSPDPKPERKPTAIATVKRPTPCCPQCEPGSIAPASQALLAFLTPEQHEQWARERTIEVTGGLSGFRYRLAHRHSPIGIRQRKICLDLASQQVLHFHDWSVPPEEEVLAAKLILEHREPWLRNEATMFFGGPRFKNPFGDSGDGTESSYFTWDIGASLERLLSL